MSEADADNDRYACFETHPGCAAALLSMTDVADGI
jgi:hypothetical protein